MKVSTLLEGLKYICCQGSTEQEVSTVVYDSRKVEENSLFICIRGAVVDGHKFVPDVIRKGAKTLVVEEEVEAPEDVTVIKVADTRYAMAFISAAYFGHPAEKLKTIGITGTKGKTTTTYMVKSILENAGYKVGLIGTIEAIIGEESIPASNTTPESYLVQEYFRKMVDAGCDCVVMEVSSQGLMLHRTQGFVLIMVSLPILNQIISDQTSIRILMIISDANLCCSGSVVWELSTEMMNTLRELSKVIPVSWKLTDFHRKPTCVQKMHIW